MGGCDQLAVIVTQRQQPGLGSLATTSDLVTTVTVGRALDPEHHRQRSGRPPLARAAQLPRPTGREQQHLHRRARIWPVSRLHPLRQPWRLRSAPAQTATRATKCSTASSPSTSSPGTPRPAASADRSRSAALTGAPGAVPANATDGSANVCAEQANGSCGPAAGRGVLGRNPIDTRYLAGVRTALANASAATGLEHGYRVGERLHRVDAGQLRQYQCRHAADNGLAGAQRRDQPVRQLPVRRDIQVRHPDRERNERHLQRHDLDRVRQLARRSPRRRRCTSREQPAGPASRSAAPSRSALTRTRTASNKGSAADLSGARPRGINS